MCVAYARMRAVIIFRRIEEKGQYSSKWNNQQNEKLKSGEWIITGSVEADKDYKYSRIKKLANWKKQTYLRSGPIFV